MTKQLNRKFPNEQVKSLLKRYLSKEIKIGYILEILGIKWSKYRQKVSLPTIIDRAKNNNFYFPRPKRKSHDREVLTNYVGELIQHDSSWHKWSPYVEEKWHLITSLDYYSRKLLGPPPVKMVHA